MKKSFIISLIILLIAIIAIFGIISTFGLNNDKENKTNENEINPSNSSDSTNLTNNIISKLIFTNNTGISDQNEIVGILDSEKYGTPGKNLTIKITVRNDGVNSVNNVKAGWMEGTIDFGTLNPGEIKEQIIQAYIPTEAEVKADFGVDSTLSNPFFIGGFYISYTLFGGKGSFNTNSIEVPLIGM
ncbi:MAG: hypothetical protein LBM96_01215 [Methanobrevibacter sp.]|jgi:hypothetical protein|nr:hypothetical protein [Candidatus Methanoflexus mossambicus]